MSKEAAMALATGQPVTQVNPSLITGDMGAVATPPPPTEVPGLDSDRFAQFAKKEAKRVQEEKIFKEERAQFEEERTKLRTVADKIHAFEEKRKTDPVSALKDIGFTETEVFNFLAAQEKKEATPEEVARAIAVEEVTKFKEEQASAAAELQKAKEVKLVSSYTASVVAAIKSDPEKYEYANFYGESAQELGLEFATQCAKLGQTVPDAKEVADYVENYYEEADQAMATIKKRQPKIESQTTDGAKKEPVRTRTVTPPVGFTPSKTLTNKTTATVASTISRKETHEQKKERLIAAVKAGTYVPKT